jgi:predicted nucleic acid-binding protein
MANGYMFDTTVFNHLLRDRINGAGLSRTGRLCVTHVQLNELQATRDPSQRTQLLNVFTAVAAERVPTETAMWDVSEWEEAKWSSEDGLFNRMLESLNHLNSRRHNNGRDILIAETAIRNGFCLVTGDSHLAQVAKEFGAEVMHLNEFLAI